MNQDRLNQLYHFMSAYPLDELKAAYTLLFLEKKNMKAEIRESVKAELLGTGWTKFDGTYDQVPKNYQWFVVGDSVFVRKITDTLPDEVVVGLSKNKVKPKTDLSMKPTDKICITCGGTLAFEPICPGCKLGRQGFTGRYVCMEDMDHEFYILKEGVILPNQGD